RRPGPRGRPDRPAPGARGVRTARPRVRREVPELHHQRGHPPPRGPLRGPPAAGRRPLVSRSAPSGGRRTDPDVPGVVGTALGAMPGTDVVESVTLLRGELGAPHISFLPVLPARGPAADPVA